MRRKIVGIYVVVEWLGDCSGGDINDVLLVGFSPREETADRLRDEIIAEGGTAIVVPCFEIEE